jgi:hypothetical protein
MPPPKMVNVNLSPVAAAVLRAMPKRSDRRVIMRQLGGSAMKFWKAQAKTQLTSTSSIYTSNLQHTTTDEKATIVLSGMIPNMVENGWKGGDMRDWLLKGPNAKMGKNGMYNTVVFRHGVPGTSGRNVGRPMPQALRNPAARLAGTLSRPGLVHGQKGGRTVVYGDRLHPNVFKMRKKAKDILNTKERPWHSTSVYMGMIRQEKMYKKSAGGQYMTFRRISQKVAIDPRTGLPATGKHWFHPGIKARNFAKATQAYIEQVADSFVQSAVGS